MVRCPNCNSLKSHVFADRPTKENKKYRYRKCINCGRNYSTVEFVVPSDKPIDDIYLLNSSDISEIVYKYAKSLIIDISRRGRIK